MIEGFYIIDGNPSKKHKIVAKDWILRDRSCLEWMSQ